MNQKEFKAFVVEEKKGLIAEVKSKLIDLPEGDLLIKVHYSALNYKDALSSIGNKGVTRKYLRQELMPLEQLYHRKLINSKLMIK
jgi:NADPH:quinone reductase-like Zn-dependent oxidoreductase